MDSYVFSPFFPSPPEFHTNHRRIPLQAPRSHQLPPATFRHTLSEGRHLNIRLLRERFFFFHSPARSAESGKHLVSPDPDVHPYVRGFSPYFWSLSPPHVLASLSHIHP